MLARPLDEQLDQLTNGEIILWFAEAVLLQETLVLLLSLLGTAAQIDLLLSELNVIAARLLAEPRLRDTHGKPAS